MVWPDRTVMAAVVWATGLTFDAPGFLSTLHVKLLTFFKREPSIRLLNWTRGQFRSRSWNNQTNRGRPVSAGGAAGRLEMVHFVCLHTFNHKVKDKTIKSGLRLMNPSGHPLLLDFSCRHFFFFLQKLLGLKHVELLFLLPYLLSSCLCSSRRNKTKVHVQSTQSRPTVWCPAAVWLNLSRGRPLAAVCFSEEAVKERESSEVWRTVVWGVRPRHKNFHTTVCNLNHINVLT